MCAILAKRGVPMCAILQNRQKSAAFHVESGALPGQYSLCREIHIALEQTQPGLCLGLFIDGGDIPLDHPP